MHIFKLTILKYFLLIFLLIGILPLTWLDGAIHNNTQKIKRRSGIFKRIKTATTKVRRKLNGEYRTTFMSEMNKAHRAITEATEGINRKFTTEEATSIRKATHEHLVKMLTEKGNPNHSVNDCGYTPMLYAIQKGMCIECANILTQHPAFNPTVCLEYSPGKLNCQFEVKIDNFSMSFLQGIVPLHEVIRSAPNDRLLNALLHVYRKKDKGYTILIPNAFHLTPIHFAIIGERLKPDENKQWLVYENTGPIINLEFLRRRLRFLKRLIAVVVEQDQMDDISIQGNYPVSPIELVQGSGVDFCTYTIKYLSQKINDEQTPQEIKDNYGHAQKLYRQMLTCLQHPIEIALEQFSTDPFFTQDTDTPPMVIPQDQDETKIDFESWAKKKGLLAIYKNVKAELSSTFAKATLSDTYELDPEDPYVLHFLLLPYIWRLRSLIRTSEKKIIKRHLKEVKAKLSKLVNGSFEAELVFSRIIASILTRYEGYLHDPFNPQFLDEQSKPPFFFLENSNRIKQEKEFFSPVQLLEHFSGFNEYSKLIVDRIMDALYAVSDNSSSSQITTRNVIESALYYLEDNYEMPPEPAYCRKLTINDVTMNNLKENEVELNINRISDTPLPAPLASIVGKKRVDSSPLPSPLTSVVDYISPSKSRPDRPKSLPIACTSSQLTTNQLNPDAQRMADQIEMMQQRMNAMQDEHAARLQSMRRNHDSRLQSMQDKQDVQLQQLQSMREKMNRLSGQLQVLPATPPAPSSPPALTD